jgi:hypothetical protein
VNVMARSALRLQAPPDGCADPITGTGDVLDWYAI